MKKLTNLIGLILFFLPSGNAQDPTVDVNQVMIAQSYFVEHILDTRIGPTHTPIYLRTISISGQPQDTCRMDHVQLFFSTDNLNNKKNPVLERTKLSVWYPMEEFDYYYEMLKHKKGKLKITYIQSVSQQKRRVEFVVNGNLPVMR